MLGPVGDRAVVCLNIKDERGHAVCFLGTKRHWEEGKHHERWRGRGGQTKDRVRWIWLKSDSTFGSYSHMMGVVSCSTLGGRGNSGTPSRTRWLGALTLSTVPYFWFSSSIPGLIPGCSVESLHFWCFESLGWEWALAELKEIKNRTCLFGFHLPNKTGRF